MPPVLAARNLTRHYSMGQTTVRALDGGTNAVAIRPPGLVRTHFGELGSAAVHAGLGVDHVILDLPGLAFDVEEIVETPYDPTAYQARLFLAPSFERLALDVIARLEKNRQVIFRYTNAEGLATDESNPNGSVANIAGLCNEQRNVVGLMPHPERACEMALGSADGLILFESAVRAVENGVGGHFSRTVVTR
jgi:hypothetical protein